VGSQGGGGGAKHAVLRELWRTEGNQKTHMEQMHIGAHLSYRPRLDAPVAHPYSMNLAPCQQDSDVSPGVTGGTRSGTYL
jgi:hypothetical protein